MPVYINQETTEPFSSLQHHTEIESSDSLIGGGLYLGVGGGWNLSLGGVTATMLEKYGRLEPSQIEKLKEQSLIPFNLYQLTFRVGYNAQSESGTFGIKSEFFVPIISDLFVLEDEKIMIKDRGMHPRASMSKFAAGLALNPYFSFGTSCRHSIGFKFGFFTGMGTAINAPPRNNAAANGAYRKVADLETQISNIKRSISSADSNTSAVQTELQNLRKNIEEISDNTMLGLCEHSNFFYHGVIFGPTYEFRCKRQWSFTAEMLLFFAGYLKHITPSISSSAFRIDLGVHYYPFL